MPQTTPWADTLRLLAHERISDLIVPAVRDDLAPRPAAAHLLTAEVYLALGRGYLQFASVNNHGGLQARPVSEIDLQPYVDDSGRDAVLSVSLADLFMSESHEVDCLQVNYVINDESDLDRGIVRCAELVVSMGQRIYFDPMYTTGVRIGNPGDWMRRYETEPWAWQRHTWTRP